MSRFVITKIIKMQLITRNLVPLIQITAKGETGFFEFDEQPITFNIIRVGDEDSIIESVNETIFKIKNEIEYEINQFIENNNLMIKNDTLTVKPVDSNPSTTEIEVTEITIIPQRKQNFEQELKVDDEVCFANKDALENGEITFSTSFGKIVSFGTKGNVNLFSGSMTTDGTVNIFSKGLIYNVARKLITFKNQRTALTTAIMKTSNADELIKELS